MVKIYFLLHSEQLLLRSVGVKILTDKTVIITAHYCNKSPGCEMSMYKV